MKFEQNWPRGSRGEVLLAILVDLPSLMIPAKVQPQGILGSGGEDL